MNQEEIQESKQVALTIIDQIENWYSPYAKSKGINYAMATMGAHNMSYDKNTLKFKVKGNRKINTVVITLNAMDTYDVSFHLCKVMMQEPYIVNNKISEHNDIYAEELGPLLKDTLGLL